MSHAVSHYHTRAGKAPSPSAGSVLRLVGVTAALSIILMADSARSAPAVSPTLFPNPVLDAGMAPVAIVATDFDGDGALDIAVANSGSDDVSILAGRGNGLFRPQARFVAGSNPTSLATGDFNGDARNDLAVSNAGSGDVSVLLGSGDGGFSSQPKVDVGANPRSLVVGDFDGDGRQDLVVARGQVYDDKIEDYRPGDVSVLLGRGDGTFTTPTRLVAGAAPEQVVVGNFDNNPHLDLAVLNVEAEYEYGHVSVFFGTGDGTFGPPTHLFAGDAPHSIAVGDLDNDGRQDLVSAARDPYENPDLVLIHRNRGDATFAPVTGLYSGSCCSLALADLTRDGNLDIVAGGPGISMIPGRGDGTFGSRITSSAGGAVALAWGDFNGDGRADVVAANTGVSVLLGLGDGTFAGQRGFGVGEGATIAVGDLDTDGHLDFAAANLFSNDVSVLLGHGDGTLGREARFPVGGSPEAIAISDLNRDGWQDVVVANRQRDVVILPGLGDGGFSPELRLAVGGELVDLKVADFNGDAMPDLVVLRNEASGVGKVQILLGGGIGSFLARGDAWFSQPGEVMGVGLWARSVEVGEFNDDGRPDLAVVCAVPPVAVLLGTGNGEFTLPRHYEVAREPYSVTVGDFDGDDHEDLAVGHYLSGISILPGRGDGGFGPHRTLDALSFWPVVAGDLDSDGTLDLAAAHGVVSVLAGLGSGEFGAPRSYIGGRGSSSLTPGDFNEDGRLDLAVSSADEIWLLLNQGGPNGPPVAVAGSDSRSECTSAQGVAVLLDGSASTDPGTTVASGDPILSHEWFEDYGRPGQVRLGTGSTLETTLPLGTHLVTLLVSDRFGVTAKDEVELSIVDTAPPTVAMELSPARLEPPNHKMVGVEARVGAVDVCGAASITLVSVTSSEPDDAPGQGDGQTVNDIQGVDLGTPDTRFRLRAERVGAGRGRTYTVIYRAADASANESEIRSTVVVP